MNQDKIWNYFQKEANNQVFSQSNSRLNYLFQKTLKLFNNSKLTVLNIGSGDGWLEKKSHQQGWETYALDPTSEAIKILECSGIKGKVGYIEQIPYADSFFDVVFCSEVIEHLSDEQIKLGLLEVERVLKKGGVLIGTVPYNENLLDNQVVCPKCGEVFHRWGHQQSFDSISFTKIFPPTLSIQTMSVHYFVDLSFTNWKSLVLSLAKKGISAIGMHGNTENLFFIVKK